MKNDSRQNVYIYTAHRHPPRSPAVKRKTKRRGEEERWWGRTDEDE